MIIGDIPSEIRCYCESLRELREARKRLSLAEDSIMDFRSRRPALAREIDLAIEDAQKFSSDSK